MSSTSTNDLISTWRLRARIYHDSTHHEFIETGNWKSLFRRKREEHLVRKKYLGRGTFGQVWLETCSIGGGGQAKFRAVKIVSKVALSADGMDYTRELEAMIRLSQSKYDAFFVKFLGWFEDPSSIYITMEYLENGDLEKHLSKQALPEVETRQIVFQVLKGLEFLHESGFAHRDLKPENIFVVQGAPDWYVKIGDFGISKRVVDENTQYRTMGVGTPGYWAPEVLGEVISMHKDRAGNMQYTRLVDIWSLGVITFYILTGSLPFEKLAELVAFVHGGPFPDSKLVNARLSESSKDFIRSLIVVEPAQRLNASLALGHSWWDSMHLTHKPGLFENSSLRGPEDASKSPIADLAAPQLDSTPTTADSISSLHSSFVQIDKL
ncbi:serine/threonine-protein kinase, partial [Aspergillus aculeatinus CBS 121060]